MGSSSADPKRSGADVAGASVAVLVGGASSEREVSKVTGAAVIDALRTPRDADDHRGPASVVPVELLEDGRWLVNETPHDPASAAVALRNVDVFFFALHGGDGEDGTLQGLFESLGSAYTGSGVRASSICMDKLVSRELVRSHGFRTPATLPVAVTAWTSDPDRVLAAARPIGDAHGWVTKPRCGGSSVGVSLVQDPAELGAAIERAFVEEDEILIEERVAGIEAACGVLEDERGEPMSVPVVEIRPHDGRFFDYEEKYSEDGAEELCPPRSFDAPTCDQLGTLAARAHTLFGCAGYSRSDFIVPSDGGDPVFLELNTLPGLTPRSLLPQAAAEAGIDYRTLCLRLVADGLERGARNR